MKQKIIRWILKKIIRIKYEKADPIGNISIVRKDNGYHIIVS